MDEHFEQPITRRGSLLALGGLAAGALGWKVDEAHAAGDGPAGVAAGAVSCVLTPEMTEGPYYVSGEKVRRNITEGRPGVPLALALTVVDASTLQADQGRSGRHLARDALGVYSGVQGDTGTFMRGVQRTERKRPREVRDGLPGLVPWGAPSTST